MAGVIATSDPATGIDIYIGQGGAPEGVLAAAALRCVGGQIQARLVFRNDDEERARGEAGHHGFRPQIHAAWILRVGRRDVRRDRRHRRLHAAKASTDAGNFITTESVVMRSATGTVRWIKARHIARAISRMGAEASP